MRPSFLIHVLLAVTFVVFRNSQQGELSVIEGGRGKRDKQSVAAETERKIKPHARKP